MGHVCVLCVCAQAYLTLCDPWTVAHQALLSMGFFSRQDYLSGLLLPPPGDLPNPGMEPTSPLSCIVGRFFTTELQGEPWVTLRGRQRIWFA